MCILFGMKLMITYFLTVSRMIWCSGCQPGKAAWAAQPFIALGYEATPRGGWWIHDSHVIQFDLNYRIISNYKNG